MNSYQERTVFSKENSIAAFKLSFYHFPMTSFWNHIFFADCTWLFITFHNLMNVVEQSEQFITIQLSLWAHMHTKANDYNYLVKDSCFVFSRKEPLLGRPRPQRCSLSLVQVSIYTRFVCLQGCRMIICLNKCFFGSYILFCFRGKKWDNFFFAYCVPQTIQRLKYLSENKKDAHDERLSQAK